MFVQAKPVGRLLQARVAEVVDVSQECVFHVLRVDHVLDVALLIVNAKSWHGLESLNTSPAEAHYSASPRLPARDRWSPRCRLVARQVASTAGWRTRLPSL